MAAKRQADVRGRPRHRSRLCAPARPTRGWPLHHADMVALGRGAGIDRADRTAGRRAHELPQHGSRGCVGRRRRARPIRLHAHHVRRPPAVAPVPEMRQGLPQDLRRARVAGSATAWCTPPPENRPTSATSIAPIGSGSGWATPRGAPSRVTTSRRSACVGKPICASRRNTRTCRTGGPSAPWSASASIPSPDHRGATFAGRRRSRPGVTVSFCSIRNSTRSRVTRWHVRAHSCLVMWVARSQSFRHDASHSAPRARTTSSAGFGGLVGVAAAFASLADGGGLVGAVAFASLAVFGGLVGAVAPFAGGGSVDGVVLSVGAACSHWAYAAP